MIRRMLVVVSVCTCFASACGGGGETAVADVPGALPVSTARQVAEDADAGAAVDGMNRFAVELLQELRAGDDKNVIISPYSISMALGMVYAGARGSTARQLEDALGLPRPAERAHASLNALSHAIEKRAADAGVELSTANQIWSKAGLEVKQPFLDTLARHYGAPMAELDFSRGGEDVVNGWVADRTNDRIQKLFPAGSFDAQTAMVLVNALYLNADWQRPFERSSTVDGEFTRSDGSTVTVPMMHNDRELPSAGTEEWQAVELAYAGDQVSMGVIVPNNIKTFERQLSAPLLDDIFASMTDGGIHFAMPRTSLTYHASLPPALQNLGIRDAFADADFSGMTADGGLALDQVEHEVFVAIDEEGTEAAAATGAEMAESHGATVEASRPYLIVIRDRPTGAILFLGVVADPSASGK